MAKVYVLLAEGFEEIEALCPVDVLRRGGQEVRLVSLDGLEVKGARGVTVLADATLPQIDDVPDLLILPGGMPGAKNLDESAAVHALLRKTIDAGRLVGAICAAPMILGKAGYLSGRRAVCYPGFEKDLAGAVLTGARVERDGPFITACGMGAALAFSEALLAALTDAQTAKSVMEQVLA
ncbi:MAG: DJ-1/PfpI family protein [Clostridiales bacterium]|nr:DJ-1/PfpI family protein [Clostridiales bacterium]